MAKLININNNNKTKEGEKKTNERFLATIATKDNEIRHGKQSIYTEENKWLSAQGKFSFFFPTNK